MSKILDTIPITYRLRDTKDDEILGGFYEYELQKVRNTSEIYQIEKIFFDEGQFMGVILENNAFSHMWAPYTTLPSTNYRLETMGDFNAILYHSNVKMLPQIQAEYSNLLAESFVTNDPEMFHLAISRANTPLEALASEIVGTEAENGVNMHLGWGTARVTVPFTK